MQQNADNTGDNTLERVTVAEAADILGITAEAVRQRIRRGTLRSEKDTSGSVFVFLDASRYRTYRQPYADATQYDDDYMDNTTVDHTELVDALRDQISSLKNEVEAWREEARRKDHLLAAALERIPAIEEAPSEPRELPLSASEEPDNSEEHRNAREKPSERRSWLYRFFFGP